MNHSNRRRFLSTIALGGTAGLAGCTSVGIGDDEEDYNSRESDDNGREEGEITDINSDATGNTIEVDFERTGREFQEQVDLVVQLMPLEYASPEVDVDQDADIRTVDRFQIVEEGQYPDSVEFDIGDYIDEAPGKNEFPFGIRLGVELESREGVNIMEVVKRGYMAYTHRESGSEEEVVTTGTRRHVWNEDGEHHFVFVHSAALTTNYYEELTEHVEFIPVFTRYSIDTELMDDLEAIYENDPLEWEDYLDTRSEGSLSSIEYLDRPIFEAIAESISETYERFNLTEDDDLYVQAAYNMINNTTSYAQPWDTVSESVRVPYPELFFRDGEGDCKAQGFAVNGILHHLGYDTSLVLFRHPDAPISTAFHHLSGGVGMDLDPETSEIGSRIEDDEGRNQNWRFPEVNNTDDRADEHISIDPSTNSIAAYSSEQTALTYYFAEGR